MQSNPASLQEVQTTDAAVWLTGSFNVDDLWDK